jgi:transcriptional regulator with GAF, ATPase, and Fis domain
MGSDREAKGSARLGVQRGWVLLVGVCIASTLGLAAAVLPLLETRIESPWPWAHTHRFLLLAFPLTVIAAVVYLTVQQRRAESMHRELLAQREATAERALKQSARFSALFSVSRIMGTEVRLQSVFDAVTQICQEAYICDQVSLMLLDKDAGELVVRSASGHQDPDMVGTRVKLGEGVAGHVAQSGRALILGPGALDPGRFQNKRQQARPLTAAVVVPIVVREELVGVLNVASHELGASYDDDDLQALRVFAENVGSCIRHAEQAEWMRQLIHRTAGNQPAPATPVEPVPQTVR